MLDFFDESSKLMPQLDLYQGLQTLCWNAPFPQKIILRPTNVNDLDWIVNLEACTPNVGHWTLGEHLAILNKPNWFHVVIEEDRSKKQVGYNIQRYHIDGNREAINSIRKVVLPEYRCSGYGTSSLWLTWLHFFEGLNTSSVEYIWLDVFTDNLDAIRLYERQGWLLDGDAFLAFDALGKPLLNSKGEQRTLLKYICDHARYKQIKLKICKSIPNRLITEF